MKLSRSFAIIVLLSTLFSASCGKTVSPSSSSSAGVLAANSALNNAPIRPFGRQTLNAAGSNYLSEFILPEVRARLDDEPVGDADGGYDPSASAPTETSSDQSASAPEGEAQGEDVQEQQKAAGNDESYPTGSRLDTLKYSWGKKAFGDAVKAAPTNSGIIVLYADEHYYDIERLMRFIEEGRNRVAENSTMPGDRIQVAFGGYRAVPQVELWVVAQGGPMPEFKPEERPKPGKTEN